MQDAHAQAVAELVIGNHVLANESVLDAFGHVSIRHPQRSRHFLLAASRAPALITGADILEFGDDSEPVQAAAGPLYLERFIHGEIYRARPDVHAVCHHHAAAIMPFCIAGVACVPVYQHGATIGATVPVWDSRSEYGDTNLLIADAVQGASVARTLGPNRMVLMRHHGATVVGHSLADLVFCAIAACRNAEYELAARTLGAVAGLSPGEIAQAGRIGAPAMDRAFAYWKSRLRAPRPA